MCGRRRRVNLRQLFWFFFCSSSDGSCGLKTAAWPRVWSRSFCLSRADDLNAFQRRDGWKPSFTQTLIPVWTAPSYSQWTLEHREASLCLSQQDLIYLYISLFVFGWLIYQWVSCALISFQTCPFIFDFELDFFSPTPSVLPAFI